MSIPAPRFLCRLKSQFSCFRTPRPPTVRSRGSVPLRHAPPTPTHPLAPPCPPPPLCMARACGVWWRADVCVPLCVSCEQWGETPLRLACDCENRDVALRLLHLGADPLIQDNDVSPPPAPLRHQRSVWGCGGCSGMCAGDVSLGGSFGGRRTWGPSSSDRLVQNHFSKFVATILDLIKETYPSLQNVCMCFW